MGLSITVQKGHDFSSGNVTRAALNAGATPTIAVTGSVGASEIAASSIGDSQIKSDAAIASTKLGLAADSLIIGDSNNIGSVLSPTSAFSNIGNDTDSNCALLVDTGAKFELLKTDVSEIGGNISLTKYKDDDDKFWLKLTVGGETLGASHLKEEDTVDKSSIVKDSAGKFSIRDNGVHYTKLYTYIKSNGVKNAGFLAYGAEGAAHVIEATADPKVLVSAGTNNNMEGKIYNKVVPLLGTSGRTTYSTDNNNTADSTDYTFVGAHGLTTAIKDVEVYLECVSNDSGNGSFGYVAGDKVKVSTYFKGDDAICLYVGWDATNVFVVCNRVPELPPKPSAASDSAITEQRINKSKWKFVALVNQ